MKGHHKVSKLPGILTSQAKIYLPQQNFITTPEENKPPRNLELGYVLHSHDVYKNYSTRGVVYDYEVMRKIMQLLLSLLHGELCGVLSKQRTSGGLPEAAAVAPFS